jgi:hypothetical protein
MQRLSQQCLQELQMRLTTRQYSRSPWGHRAIGTGWVHYRRRCCCGLRGLGSRLSQAITCNRTSPSSWNSCVQRPWRLEASIQRTIHYHPRYTCTRQQLLWLMLTCKIISITFVTTPQFNMSYVLQAHRVGGCSLPWQAGLCLTSKTRDG